MRIAAADPIFSSAYNLPFNLGNSAIPLDVASKPNESIPWHSHWGRRCFGNAGERRPERTSGMKKARHDQKVYALPFE